jgi:hypothetical protein
METEQKGPGQEAGPGNDVNSGAQALTPSAWMRRRGLLLKFHSLLTKRTAGR